MTGHRRAQSFIRYVLPVLAGGKPTNPGGLEEQGGKGKPRPITTMALGEETGTTRPGSVTTMVVGEESGGSGS